MAVAVKEFSTSDIESLKRVNEGLYEEFYKTANLTKDSIAKFTTEQIRSLNSLVKSVNDSKKGVIQSLESEQKVREKYANNYMMLQAKMATIGPRIFEHLKNFSDKIEETNKFIDNNTKKASKGINSWLAIVDADQKKLIEREKTMKLELQKMNKLDVNAKLDQIRKQNEITNILKNQGDALRKKSWILNFEENAKNLGKTIFGSIASYMLIGKENKTGKIGGLAGMFNKVGLGTTLSAIGMQQRTTVREIAEEKAQLAIESGLVKGGIDNKTKTELELEKYKEEIVESENRKKILETQFKLIPLLEDEYTRRVDELAKLQAEGSTPEKIDEIMELLTANIEEMEQLVINASPEALRERLFKSASVVVPAAGSGMPPEIITPTLVTNEGGVNAMNVTPPEVSSATSGGRWNMRDARGRFISRAAYEQQQLSATPSVSELSVGQGEIEETKQEEIINAEVERDEKVIELLTDIRDGTLNKNEKVETKEKKPGLIEKAIGMGEDVVSTALGTILGKTAPGILAAAAPFILPAISIAAVAALGLIVGTEIDKAMQKWFPEREGKIIAKPSGWRDYVEKVVSFTPFGGVAESLGLMASDVEIAKAQAAPAKRTGGAVGSVMEKREEVRIRDRVQVMRMGASSEEANAVKSIKNDSEYYKALQKLKSKYRINVETPSINIPETIEPIKTLNTAIQQETNKKQIESMQQTLTELKDINKSIKDQKLHVVNRIFAGSRLPVTTNMNHGGR